MNVEDIIINASEALEKSAYEKAYTLIREGLRLSPQNYELYYILGEWYLYKNINLSYLCFEHASYYALSQNAPQNDIDMIEGAIDFLKHRGNPTVNNTSIIVLSYNDCDLMKECLNSIWKYTDKRHTETIVVDNASTDGIAEWLREQKDILLIEPHINLGFSKGCNLGFSYAHEGNDIFFLNNDAVLTPNSLFWLRMALYTSHDTGMVSGVSNNAITQEIELPDTSLPACMKFGIKNNIPEQNALEIRARLTGFALLLKSTAIKSILINARQIFDEKFSPAYFEDDDLGLRLSASGWREYLVHNAFIYHKGGAGFDKENRTLANSREVFKKKWGFDMWAYELPWEESIEKLLTLEKSKYKPIRILLIGTGIGATLSHIKWLYPNSECVGFEESVLLAGLARFSGKIVCCGLDSLIEEKYTEIQPHSFDHVLADLSCLDEPEATRCRELFKKFLKPNGTLIE